MTNLYLLALLPALILIVTGALVVFFRYVHFAAAENKANRAFDIQKIREAEETERRKFQLALDHTMRRIAP